MRRLMLFARRLVDSDLSPINHDSLTNSTAFCQTIIVAIYQIYVCIFVYQYMYMYIWNFEFNSINKYFFFAILQRRMERGWKIFCIFEYNMMCLNSLNFFDQSHVGFIQAVFDLTFIVLVEDPAGKISGSLIPFLVLWY